MSIPRTLHRIWLGGEMPGEFIEYGRGWRRHHAGWKHILWTDSAQPYMEGVVVRSIPPLRINNELYARAEEIAGPFVGQFRADILRYEILWAYGGVYVDADFECLRAIDPLLDGVRCFAAWERQDVWVNNAILGAVTYHPFIDALVRGLAANVAQRPGQRPNKLSGPQYLTPLYRAAGADVTVFEQRLFYPYSHTELARKGEAFPEAYAVHHWHNARRRRGMVPA